MRPLRWALVLGVAASLVACGDGSGGGAGGAGASAPSGSSSTEATSTGAASAACPEGYLADHLLAAREDEVEGCLDVDAEAIEVIDVCAPLDESDHESFPFAYCFRRVSDGAEYWVVAPWGLRILPVPATWEFCDEVPTTKNLPPHPCFTGACPGSSTPTSSCAEGATRFALGCGEADRSWDENCCRRPFCDPSGECAEGYECREIDEGFTGPCWLTVRGGEDPSSVDLDSMEACYCMGGEALPQTYCFPVGEGG